MTELTTNQAIDLKNRFTYHKPAEGELAFFEKVRGAAWDLAAYIVKELPDCREASLAVTKLEEAVMWANAARARHTQAGRRKVS